MEVIAVQLEFLQLAFEPAGYHTQIEQGCDKHVAGDAADKVKIQSFHELLFMLSFDCSTKTL